MSKWNNINKIFRRFMSNIKHNVSSDANFEKLIENYQSKLIFSSYVESTKLGYVRNKKLELKLEKYRKKLIEDNKLSPFPISLKYLDPDTVNTEIETESNSNKTDQVDEVYFPYSRIAQNKANYEEAEVPEIIQNTEICDDNITPSSHSDSEKAFKSEIAHNWMSDYDIYTNDLDNVLDCADQYGTPDANFTKMGPACGGCGALLNCISTSMPGYLPSELYKGKTEKQLKGVTCQRCHFLKNYNIALNVTVEPDYYNKLLSTLYDKFGLIVLLVDLLDFPCCIWPGLVDLIGSRRPIFVVGNKVDLLPKDSKGYLKHIAHCLEEAVLVAGFKRSFIKNVSLVSATTGYGIEQLISQLHGVWRTKGDVYIVGCTNVGKSTIFNALLGSDFCKVQALDLIQRATASPWPGTTLKMLRFPILRPSALRMHVRYQRLKHEEKEAVAEKKLRKIQEEEGQIKTPLTLMGHIGTTFRTQLAEEDKRDPFSSNVSKNPQDKGLGINENSKEFKFSRWCYDTPGVMHDNQILDLLTADEILKTLPQKTIRIRNYCVQPGMSLLLAGLGRVDYLEGAKSVRLSVFASECLPIVICRTVDVEEIYDTFLGTPVLGVPEGSSERLNQWPGLKEGEEVVKVVGEDDHRASVDLLLSSAGWVSVTPYPNQSASFRHFTVGGRGAIVRSPPLILYGSTVRGARVQKSPAYKVVDYCER